MAPNSNELEFSVFGPGFGECIVIHLGNGEWMVVDSCLNNDKTESIASDYLRSLKVNIEQQVKLQVVSHWHADHISGAAAMFKQSKSARFACSGALASKEFFDLLSASGQTQLIAAKKSGSEFLEILDELNDRYERGKRAQRGPDVWAQDGMPLLPKNDLEVKVTAISPSSQTLTDAAIAYEKLIPSPGDRVIQHPRNSPNDQSVAIVVESKYFSVLLGADLENVSDPAKGWQAVIDSTVRSAVRSHAVKVAHHGSENGDHPELWTSLLESNPTAFVTRFASGRKPLPSPDDIKRLQSRTDKLYCTSRKPTQKAVHSDSSVRRTIAEMTSVFRSINRSVGHLRLRVSLIEKNEPTIEVFEGGCKLN
jgi:beta-lactamase superfamily II metal-dependent hydrolase